MTGLPFRIRTVILGALAMSLIAVGITAGPATAARASKPYVHGNETVPTYSYANAVRESVSVDTKLDNDGDGRPDTVAVDIVRPREAAQQGVKVPVIMEASPYYSCCGRGNESQKKAYDANGVITSMPLYYDNYFVPRGYAFVGVDLAGTNRSKGCGDTGGPEEVGSAKAVVDWLNGRTTAHDRAGKAVTADWTSGKVGMIGKSWDGTIANGVAATGVDGLKTIVPVSAISSWYDYMRLDGVVRSTDYPGGLAQEVGGRGGVCTSEYNGLNQAGDDATGNDNAFWQQRDYVKSAANVKASVFAIHGLNDQNVYDRNFDQWWNALAAHNVPRKVWLHQEGHTDPFDIRRGPWVDELHQWFDYWLQGLNNGVMDQPKVTAERAPNQWQDQADYPAPGTTPVTLHLGAGSGAAGTLGTAAGTAGTPSIKDNPNLKEAQVVANPTASQAGRMAFLSQPLGADLHVSGDTTVTLKVKVNKSDTELTARLVDYGQATRDDYLANDLSGIKNLTTKSCYGDSTAADSACYLDTAEQLTNSAYGIESRGWLDAAHHTSLSSRTPLTPGQWYTMTVRLQPQDQIIAKGHTLGVVLSLSDTENTTPSSTGATATVDLSGSSVSLPAQGWSQIRAATGAPELAAPAPSGTSGTRRPSFR